MLSSSRSFDAERKAVFSFTFSVLYSASPLPPLLLLFFIYYLFYYFCKQFVFLHKLLFSIYTYSVTSRIHIPAGGVYLYKDLGRLILKLATDLESTAYIYHMRECPPRTSTKTLTSVNGERRKLPNPIDSVSKNRELSVLILVLSCLEATAEKSCESES